MKISFLCIIFGVLIPNFFTSFILFILDFLRSSDSLELKYIFKSFIKNMLVCSVSISLIFSGVQSVIYTLIMNLYIFHEVNSRRNIILISTILGAILTVIPVAMIYFGNIKFYLYGLFLGCIIGAISGYLLLKVRDLSLWMVKKLDS